MSQPGVARWVALTLCTASAFFSAFLLFALEPLITRVLLTRYGGSAAVWNTALVFFQAALFVGYLYAARVPRWLGERRHLYVHAVVVLLPIAFLPLALRWSFEQANPVASILLLLLLNVGVPFFALASNSTLIQIWYARLSGDADPSWLYAASNVGSILALLMYPLLAEPLLGIRQQSEWWRVAYLLFAALSIVVLVVVARRPGTTTKVETDGAPPQRMEKLGWVIRAAVASSLLMSVTLALTNAIGSTPLLWTIPLLLYLLTFVIAFGKLAPRRQPVVWFCVGGIALSLATLVYTSPVVVVPVYLITLFAGSLLCHSDLFQRRPDAQYLPSFYLALSIGGLAGGVFNAVMAPLLFQRMSEFPITLAALAMVLDADRPWRENFPAERLRRGSVLLPPVTMLAMIVFTYIFTSHQSSGVLLRNTELLRTVMLVAVLLFGVLLSRHRGQFAVAALLVCVFLVFGPTWNAVTLREERSFFGIASVVKRAGSRVLLHNGVVHGSQLDPPRQRIATTYYHAAGPFGASFRDVPPGGRIGVVGLGTGTLAALLGPTHHADFFEIDPAIGLIAATDFTFLRDTRASVNVEIGDGRVLLEKRPDASYDLLAIDAFSGGSVPLHLLTTEAMEMYLRKCKSDGIVLLHISNKHVNLAAALRGWSRATGRPVVYHHFKPEAGEIFEGASQSTLAAIAPSRAATDALLLSGRWSALPAAGESVLWTDDRASVLPVLKLFR